MNNDVINAILSDYESISEIKISENGIDEIKNLKITSYIHSDIGSYYRYYNYLKSIVHPYEVKLFEVILAEENICYKISKRESSLTTFNLKFKDTYETYVFKILYPNEDSSKALLTWKKLNNDMVAWIDGIKLIDNLYEKVTKVDLINDTFNNVKLGEIERSFSKFSVWCKSFAESSIFVQDIAPFIKFMKNINTDEFKPGEIRNIKYRKRTLDGTYNWYSTEVIKSVQNDYAMLYTRNIHQEVSYQLISDRKISYYDTHNLINGLLNKRGLEENLASILPSNEFGIILIKVIDYYSFDSELTNYVTKKMSDYFGIHSSFDIEEGLFLVKSDLSKEAFLNLLNNSFLQEISKACKSAYRYGKDLNQMIRDCYVEIFGSDEE